MKRVKDLTGNVYGKLTVIKLSHINKKYEKCWTVQCDCEDKTEFSLRGSSLTSGRTKSCGCLTRKATSERQLKLNIYDLTGEYGIGYTTKGEEFYFDLEDYDKIKEYCWYIDKTGYVRTNRVTPNLKFHTLILNERLVDHIDGITNNNRKYNLRSANEMQNAQNARLRTDNTSGVKGVKWFKPTSIWMAQINYNNTRYHLGYFEFIEDAKKVREISELYLFAEYSRRYKELNIIYKDINLDDFVKKYIPKIYNLKKDKIDVAL